MVNSWYTEKMQCVLGNPRNGVITQMNESMSKNELAYRKLKEAIITNEILPNQILIERKLSEELGLSRTPTRSALLRLEKEGFVESIPNKGIFVLEVKLKDIVEIYEFREALDPLALKLSTRGLEGSLGDEMLECVQEQKLAYETIEKSGKWDDFFAKDTRFHTLYVERCNNTRVINAYNNLLDQISRFSYTTYGDMERAARTISEHSQIAQEVSVKNIERASFLLVEHLRGIKEYYINRTIQTGNF